jgi:hypothetical protein
MLFISPLLFHKVVFFCSGSKAGGVTRLQTVVTLSRAPLDTTLTLCYVYLQYVLMGT